MLAGLGESVRRLDGVGQAPHLLVLTDSNVGPLYLEEAKSSLRAAGFRVSDIVVPAGEDSKSLAVAGEIWSAMASLGLTRDCAVVALGGGVVGDLAGFVASTYMRGIPFVQVPTSLLAMVDSSVGGKTGVNLPEGKNLVGTFKQPAYVCASTAVLATLDDREWACGCAEIAKASVIDSDEFFFWMMDHASALEARDPVVVTEAIARSVVFKANVVAEDKTESRGVRECLNYGHTLGHAVEALAGYGTFSHGAAVAEGMRFAARLGVDAGGYVGRAGGCPRRAAGRAGAAGACLVGAGRGDAGRHEARQEDPRRRGALRAAPRHRRLGTGRGARRGDFGASAPVGGFQEFVTAAAIGRGRCSAAR